MKNFNLISALVTVVAASPALDPRQSSSQIATVDIAVSKGAPGHLASGFIYGIPDNYPNQIPLHWYTDMGIKNCKGGGAQLGNVGYRGWVVSLNDYKGRFQSLLDNYKTCRAAGGEFSIYVHDLFGTDHASSSTHWPGDNGDWSDYDKFVAQLMSDVKANMDLAHVTWDVWNEPDISIFWTRSTQQWVDMYVRTHKAIRANSAFNAMKVSGPALAYRPEASNKWWTSWLSALQTNKLVPDQYTYHLEGGLTDTTNDPQYTNSSLTALLKQYGLPQRQVFANEYAEASEMVPGGYIWWISRLERYEFLGMLGNWLGGTMLHDLFGGLLTKKSNRANYAATDYVAAAGYPVYKYYNLNMTGQRVQTTGSSDRWFDTYATKGSDKVRILAGVKVNTGTWQVNVQGLSSIGYTSGQVPVTTLSFDGQSVTSIVGDATNHGVTNYNINNGVISIPVKQTNKWSGWAFEIPVKN